MLTLRDLAVETMILVGTLFTVYSLYNFLIEPFIVGKRVRRIEDMDAQLGDREQHVRLVLAGVWLLVGLNLLARAAPVAGYYVWRKLF